MSVHQARIQGKTFLMTALPRVAMLINQFLPGIGGAERQVAMLGALLADRGVDVHVVTRWRDGCPALERMGGLTVHRVPARGTKGLAAVSFTAHAAAALGRIRPDIIHAHDLLSCGTTAMLARLLYGTPVVVTAHRSGSIGDIGRLHDKPFGDTRIALLRRNVDAFIAISRDINAELAAHGVPEDRRVSIPNGIDTRRFSLATPQQRAEARTAIGVQGGPVALFAGRLAVEKRLDLLLSVWPDVRRSHPTATLLIVGDGEMEAELRRIESPGVEFRGRTDDVLPYLRASDVFVLPSIAEGLSVALLEAQSTGAAVLATDVGGARDIIDDGVDGLLIEPGNPDQLRDGLLRLFADDALRARMRRAASARVARRNDMEGALEKLLELYLRLAPRHGRIRYAPHPSARVADRPGWRRR
ncbi:glycosyltransferase family 4 protein [Azospirillum sp. TSO35-2]|uniref:glycosyltransferase family 4 protein n=1 Tax=Azospirillum sp. TSO35-2 TaxID=716796 RepID=UPI001304FEC4|nr:glycosyltransferase family 4 protein [Azospirillum sp. TSO35-2]